MKHFHLGRSSASPVTVNVVAQVATPQLSIAVGWVKVAGLWQEPGAVPAVWRARRTAYARWGPVAPAQRQAWRDKGL